MRRDLVLINELSLNASIGVFEWEHEVEQTLIFDLELDTDFGAAAADDDIQKALDYTAVVARIKDCVAAKHYRLLETLAETIAEDLMSDDSVVAIKLSIRKPGAVAGTRDVGVRVERN